MLERLSDVPTAGLHRYEYRIPEKSTNFLVKRNETYLKVSEQHDAPNSSIAYTQYIIRNP
jgi:hypothetical protein